MSLPADIGSSAPRRELVDPTRGEDGAADTPAQPGLVRSRLGVALVSLIAALLTVATAALPVT